MDLTVLCVTRAEPHVWPFLAVLDQLAKSLKAEFLIAADGEAAQDLVGCHRWLDAQIRCVNSRGYIEDVLDDAVEQCQGEYVLRVDDDEICSPALVRWMRKEGYFTANHWRFQRAHLWPDGEHFITNEPLWPDWQTRLSLKRMAGGRRAVRGRSPFGAGIMGPGALLHHKFLVRPVEDRRQAMARGIGPDLLPYYVPEDYWSDADQLRWRNVTSAEAA